MRWMPASPVNRRSLGEAFALCRGAARGAGMPWGMADECGRAARWLVRAQLPLEPLAALLANRRDACAPDPDSRPLRAAVEGKALCPLLTGALLSDEARSLAREGECDLEKTAHPILLTPFLTAIGEDVELKWKGARLFLRGEAVYVLEEDSLLAEEAERVAVRIRKGAPIPEGAHLANFPPPDEAVWKWMGALAARTYVPSGEVSRRDAGAESSDND